MTDVPSSLIVAEFLAMAEAALRKAGMYADETTVIHIDHVKRELALVRNAVDKPDTQQAKNGHASPPAAPHDHENIRLAKAREFLISCGENPDSLGVMPLKAEKYFSGRGEKLTLAEVRVAQLRAFGLGFKEIAELLVVAPSTIATQVHAVYRKGGFNTFAMIFALFGKSVAPEPGRFSGFTARQREVAVCIGTGLSQKEAGEKLGTDRATIAQHVGDIYGGAGIGIESKASRVRFVVLFMSTFPTEEAQNKFIIGTTASSLTQAGELRADVVPPSALPSLDRNGSLADETEQTDLASEPVSAQAGETSVAVLGSAAQQISMPAAVLVPACVRVPQQPLPINGTVKAVMLPAPPPPTPAPLVSVLVSANGAAEMKRAALPKMSAQEAKGKFQSSMEILAIQAIAMAEGKKGEWKDDFHAALNDIESLVDQHGPNLFCDRGSERGIGRGTLVGLVNGVRKLDESWIHLEGDRLRLMALVTAIVSDYPHIIAGWPEPEKLIERITQKPQSEEMKTAVQLTKDTLKRLRDAAEAEARRVVRPARVGLPGGAARL